jgi:hypothetical protein
VSSAGPDHDDADPARPRWAPAARTAAAVLLAHPGLAPSGIAAVLRLARRGWWHRWPPVPLPGDRYWEFRVLTAFGGRGETPLRPSDVRAYLRWCRRMPGARG